MLMNDDDMQCWMDARLTMLVYVFFFSHMLTIQPDFRSSPQIELVLTNGNSKSIAEGRTLLDVFSAAAILFGNI